MRITKCFKKPQSGFFWIFFSVCLAAICYLLFAHENKDHILLACFFFLLFSSYLWMKTVLSIARDLNPNLQHAFVCSAQSFHQANWMYWMRRLLTRVNVKLSSSYVTMPSLLSLWTAAHILLIAINLFTLPFVQIFIIKNVWCCSAFIIILFIIIKCGNISKVSTIEVLWTNNKHSCVFFNFTLFFWVHSTEFKVLEIFYVI